MLGVTFDNTKIITAGALATASGLFVGALYYKQLLKNRPPLKWTKIGHVEQLCIYPVKSFKGVTTSSFRCTPRGPQLGHMRDRTFVVVNSEGKFVTGRDYPKITQLVAKISGSVVTFCCPDDPEEIEIDMADIGGVRKEVEIWDVGTDGVDCGDEVAVWLSRKLLGEEKGLRMLYCGDDAEGKRVNGRVTAYSKMVDVQLEKSDGGFFSDGVSYHLISQASIKELNSRLDGTTVHPLNFRPNIVVTGEQLIPFEEDNWQWLRIGQVVFRCLSPCTRCLFTTVNPFTGEKSEATEPLKALRRFRFVRNEAQRKLLTTPAMGIYLGLRSEGSISLGDEVFVPET